MRNQTVPRLSPALPRPLRHTLDRIAILNSSGHVSGARSHLTALLADQWRAAGIEVIELAGTRSFVEADLLFLNLSRPVVPEEYTRFAAQYPVTFNAGAMDLRKHRYADGLLQAGASYKGAVIVKADPAHAGQAAPERVSLLRRLTDFHRTAEPREATANDNYRIYACINDVPAEKFAPGYIVQKFLPEESAGRYILRQYHFLGHEHFLSLQTSSAAIIRTSIPQSLEEWAPPQELLDLRARLKLDYGRIDFVEVDGKPFVISVSRSPALPVSKEPGFVPPAYFRLAEALADAMVDIYSTTEKAVF